MKKIRIKLNAKRVEDGRFELITEITHIKLIDAGGNYIKFAKHSDELLEALREQVIEMEVPDDLPL